MDMEVFVLNNGETSEQDSLDVMPSRLESHLKRYGVKSVKARYERCQDVVIDSALITFEGIRLQGKRLSSFQEEQTTFNTETEQRLDSLEAEKTALSKRLAKLEERNNMSSNQEVVLSLQCGCLQEYLTYLRGLEDIREQLQYSTLVLKELDRMFAFCSEKTGRFHRQLILKLRSAIKLNCDKFLFTDKQIDVLVKLAEELKMPGMEKKQVLAALDCLMDVDLSPFPNLEDEDETVSGHDGSN